MWVYERCFDIISSNEIQVKFMDSYLSSDQVLSLDCVGANDINMLILQFRLHGITFYFRQGQLYEVATTSFFIKINHKRLLWRTVKTQMKCRVSRLKLGNFGHRLNSDIHMQTVEILMRRLLMSISLFVLLIYFYSNN